MSEHTGYVGVIEGLWASVVLSGLGYLAWSCQVPLGSWLTGLWLRLAERYRPGDHLEFEGISGHLQRITARGAELCTLDGETMLVPNDLLVRSRVLVREQGASLPLKTCLTIGYERDLGQSRRCLEDVLAQLSTPDRSQPRRVGIRELTPDGVVFELSWWNQADADPRESVFEVRTAVARALEAA